MIGARLCEMDCIRTMFGHYRLVRSIAVPWFLNWGFELSGNSI